MRWITEIRLLSCLIATTAAELLVGALVEASNDLNSTNWSGAIQSVDNSDSFNSVSSTIVLPTITGPTDAEYSAYVWVGIDGWGGLNNLFQAGIDIQAIQSDDGSYYPQFRGYYEWYPEGPQFYTIDELPLSNGDTLYINITATSKTTGTVYLENETNGISQSFNFDEPDYPLTGRYAEWIVEEFSENPVPYFGSINFASTWATTWDGNSSDASSASLVQVDDNRLQAAISGSTVSISV